MHRDISVYNVLLTRGLRAKLSDLGVARVLQHDDMPPLSLVPGHQAYMPPEAFMENPSYDQSLDVFSFGKLIVNVESGKCPDDDDVKWGEVDSADVIAGPLKDLAFRCTAADPRKRPSIDEIVDDIEKKHELDPIPFQHSVELLLQLEAKEKEIRTLKERPHLTNGGNHFDSTDKKIPALEALHNVPLPPPAANPVGVQTLPRTMGRLSGRPQSTYDLSSEKTLPAHHGRSGTWGHNHKPRRMWQVNESESASGATPELAALLARRRQWEQKH